MARNELKITYYPKGSKSLNDGISVGDLVKILVGEARRRHAALFKKVRLEAGSATCARCGAERGFYRELAVQHKKPIWVYAMELIMSAPPQNFAQYSEMARQMMLGKIALDSHCHEAGNVETLCAQCHSRSEIDAYDYWKGRFTASYRVVFGREQSAHQRYLSEPIEYMPKWR